MSFSREWTEWHLTPRGWESGSECVDFQGTTEKASPPDRVVTYEWREEQTSPYAKMHRGHTVKWECGEKALIAKLIEQFGGPPSHL